jgi:hypothetical protein
MALSSDLAPNSFSTKAVCVSSDFFENSAVSAAICWTLLVSAVAVAVADSSWSFENAWMS